MIFPVKHQYRITTYFDPASHPGIDIAPIPAGKQGVPCYSPENGTVVSSGYVATLEGNYCIIKGDSGYYYYFGHFADKAPAVNTRVLEGSQIGTLGMTGKATGIHTHHEVRTARAPGNSIDPMPYYEKRITSTGGTTVAGKVSKELVENLYRYVGGYEGPADAVAWHVANSTPEGLMAGFINNDDLAVPKLRAELETVRGELAVARKQATDFGTANTKLSTQVSDLEARLTRSEAALTTIKEGYKKLQEQTQAPSSTINDYSLGELLSAAFAKLFKIK